MTRQHSQGFVKMRETCHVCVLSEQQHAIMNTNLWSQGIYWTFEGKSQPPAQYGTVLMSKSQHIIYMV